MYITIQGYRIAMMRLVKSEDEQRIKRDNISCEQLKEVGKKVRED